MPRPTIGTLAVDVKAKRIYQNTILIDAYEHRTLLAFETFFTITVWFACFPPDEPPRLPPLPEPQPRGVGDHNRQGETVIAVPLRLTKAADERRDFMAAVLGAIRLR